MEWTIEKVRELPPDNYLGIKRIGEHMWQVGGDIPGGLVMYTGDRGVLDYVNAFNHSLVEEMIEFSKNYGLD